MKFKRGIKSLCILFVTLFMFTGCELLALAAVANAFSDELENIAANSGVKIVNETGETITLVYSEDPSTIYEGYTPRNGEILLVNGASKDNVFTTGYFKLTINGLQVRPKGIEEEKDYYSIPAYTTLTVTRSGLSYVYEVVSNSSYVY